MFIVTVLLMTLMGSIAASCLKKASYVGKGIIGIIFNPMFILGGFLYVGSAMLNLLLLKQYDYTVVFPLTTITYAWTILIGYMVFKENLNFMKIVAVLLIISGAFSIVTF